MILSVHSHHTWGSWRSWLEVFVQLPDDQVLTIYGLHEDGFTLPAPDPSIRLDYIFADPVRQVATQPRVVRIASDHLPLLVEFKV